MESVADLSAGSSDLVPSTGATAEGGSSGDLDGSANVLVTFDISVEENVVESEGGVLFVICTVDSRGSDAWGVSIVLLLVGALDVEGGTADFVGRGSATELTAGDGAVGSEDIVL